MKSLDAIPALRASAVAMLPGMRHARALLDVSIRVLEYFTDHAAKDANNGTSTTFTPPPPELKREVETARSMLSAFVRLH